MIKKISKKSYTDRYLWLMVLPGIIWYIVFAYAPMYGLVIAFLDFSPYKGIMDSVFVGMKWFKQFYNSQFFWPLVKNTLLLNIYNIIFAFPVPILLALVINDVKNKRFKKISQTISYLPYFVSTVVIVGILTNFLSSGGIINKVINSFGGETIRFLLEPKWFRTIYISSGIWQHMGWNSIIYIAALAGVDPSLYEASVVDGASKFKQLIYISLPSIMPTIIIMLILNLGRILSVGYEKIILLYSPAIYETADVINTYVYRRGVASGEFSFGTAVGLFQSVINCIFVFSANKISKKVSDVGLW